MTRPKLLAILAMLLLSVVVLRFVPAKTVRVAAVAKPIPTPQSSGLVCTASLDFGPVVVGQVKIMQITCTNTSTVDFHGTITVDNPQFHLQPDPPTVPNVLIAKKGTK